MLSSAHETNIVEYQSALINMIGFISLFDNRLIQFYVINQTYDDKDHQHHHHWSLPL